MSQPNDDGCKASTPEETKRVKKLSEKAGYNFDKKVNHYQTKLINYQKELEETIMTFKTADHWKKCDTIDLKNKLNACFDQYETVFEEMSEYLTRTHTAESLKELETQKTIHRTVAEKLVVILNEMELRLKNVSLKAPSTRHSQCTKSSSSQSNKSAILLANQKAKVKAAQTRLEFERKEAAIKEQKAKLEEKLCMLDKEKDVAVETAVLETLEEELNSDGNSQYHSELYDEEIIGNPKKFEFEKSPHPGKPKLDPLFEPSVASGLNPNAKPFNFDLIAPTQSVSVVNDISKYLLKKELLIQRFQNFSDKPEDFQSWKLNFREIVRELNVTPIEEYDLLLKYLGPLSRNHAQSIRHSNPNDIERALRLLWDRLHERFGSPELIERSLKQRLERFPAIKDNSQLYNLSDLCREVESTKRDPNYAQLLSYFDSSTGVKPIVEKLPFYLKNKWMSRASNYKRVNSVVFPPFSEFCDFLEENSVMLNDPGLSLSVCSSNKGNYKSSVSSSITNDKIRSNAVHVKKTISDNTFVADSCPIHRNTLSHNLNTCKTFKARTVSDRKKYLKDNNICYKCCNSTSHAFKTCSFSGRCDECGSDKHPSGLHNFHLSRDQQQPTLGSGMKKPPLTEHGREPSTINPTAPPSHTEHTPRVIHGKCTSICGSGFTGKSCSKTLLVKVHPVNHPEDAKMVYCIIDDQSNRSLCRSELFQILNTNSLSVGVEDYDLVSCSGKSMCSGRTLDGLIVTSPDNNFSVPLPTVLECDSIPNSRSEIPTPDIPRYHPHLRDVPIPPLQEDVNISLLIGRDVPQVHQVLEQRVLADRPDAPFAQRLSLGWVIIGEVCLNSHRPDVKVMKTYIHKDGRPSLFEPCRYKLLVKTLNPDQVEADIFVQTQDDNKIGLSVEDKEFIEVMDDKFHKDETGHWSAPLPFRSPRRRLPGGKKEVYRRAMAFEGSLKRNPEKLQHSLDFMGNLIDKGYCERAPPLQDGDECWYLPLFGIYHPKKKDKIRIVFDSSCKIDGVSLNSVLMTGLDMTNSLTGILMRFRRERVAVTGDIEQMFYQFRVNKEHRNFLRFLWYENNDFNKPLVDYQMCVHVFGNSPSPAVATYGLRRTALNAIKDHGETMFNFVSKDFYVDDGLTSLASEDDAVSLISNTQKALQDEGKLRFHKLVSNSAKVLNSFDKEDFGKDLKLEDSPVQRSLGLSWSLDQDCFIFQLDKGKKEFYTKRSVLAAINSLYDPLGFLSPATITGKILLRDITNSVHDWDEHLPEQLHQKWLLWFKSLHDLETLRIPRTYFPHDVRFDFQKTLHVFCDASEKAIAAVAYLKTGSDNVSIGYVFGKTKVAPKHSHTIPRLELCAAVLATEIAETVLEELCIQSEDITYYTDSKVVLGYLNNKTRRFYVYVENRVSRILQFSKATQWRYIESENNPADEGTRGVQLSELQHCKWLSGEPLLAISDSNCEQYQLQNPDNDIEIRSTVKTMKTDVKLETGRFDRFSSWRRLLAAISVLINFVRQFKTKCNLSSKSSDSDNDKSGTLPVLVASSQYVIKLVQNEAFPREIECLEAQQSLPKGSHVLNLAPYLDEGGILRVGGRLKHSHLPKNEKHPILIPSRSHIATLLVRHFHEEVHHQGRHITEGAVRAGFWITGCKRLIANIIYSCITCRKLRGKFSTQMMSDLPSDRTTPAPPFTFVGVDVFGPWNIVTRRTRGGSATSKRWAVLFTCLTIRAVHIEVIEEMSSSSFINALRRFISIRGNVKLFRSDKGSNFVGATEDLGIDAINVEDRKIANFLQESGSTWVFNPPHASHMGGVWERMIGVTRRILDAILLENRHKNLTHEVLATFMAEVCAIINARPITPVSSDPENPFILSPSVLLTQKCSNTIVSTFQYLDVKDMYRAQWKCVQVLAEIFWKRWSNEYLSQLQPRKIWQNKSENINIGDVVLLREKSLYRNDWPMGIVKHVYSGKDGLVRNCSVKVIKEGKTVEYVRPIVELVKLLD